MGGRISVESVVRCSWNGWPDDRGIRTLGLKRHGLAVGNDADLVMVDCRAVADVILDLPTRLMVLKRGRVVATAEHRRSVAF
ncbi:hypothetical protein LU666_08755, partial [Pseudomonas putida]|nr:hypothetical protein [Pseudomonas putida]